MNLIQIAIVVYCACGITANAQRVWTLKECLDTALVKNISIRQGYLSSEISKINLIQANASKLPNLYLNDSHSLNSGFSLDPYTNQYTTRNVSSNNLSLNSSIYVFNGHVLLYTIKQNRLLVEAGLLDNEKIKVDVTLNVLAAFMQVLMDYAAIDMAKQQVTSSDTLVVQTKKFLRFGKVAELSLLQTQSQLASDKLLQINTQNQLQLDKLTLLQLMETPVDSSFEIKKHETEDSLLMITPSSSEINDISLGFMPQIKSAAIKIDASKENIKIVECLRIPSLVLSGGVKTGYSSIRSNFNTDTSFQLQTIGYLKGDLTQPVTGDVAIYKSTNQTQNLADQLKNNFGEFITLTLSVPIFNRYVARNSIAIAKVNVRVAQLNEQQTKNDLRKIIETVYTNQITAGKKMLAVKEQLDLERRTYTDIQIKYSFGAVDATTFLIEKNNFDKASMLFIQAKYDYALKLKMVDFYLNKPLNY